MLKTKIAVLVSGGGTNLQALIDAENSGLIKNGEIVLVASNNPNAFALQRAEDNGIKAVVMSSEEALLQVFREEGIELVVLAGFLKILSPAFISAYENRIINIHPSLIPSFLRKGLLWTARPRKGFGIRCQSDWRDSALCQRNS